MINHSYFKNRYRGRNKWTYKYNHLIQELTFGRTKCAKWWHQEHTYLDIKNYHFTNKIWSEYSFRQLKAITLHQHDTPLSNRKFNIIKQMKHASTRSHEQGLALIDYLKSKLVLSSLLENRPQLLHKIWLFKPLIALNNGIICEIQGGNALTDKVGQPILDIIHKGISTTATKINRCKNNFELLTMNTEFKPTKRSLINNDSILNIHAQGLGLTTTKYTINEQRHVEATIGKLFSKATGYKRSKPHYKNGKLTYSKGNFVVMCPGFKLRNSRHDNDNMTLSYIDNIGCQEKYPLLNKPKAVIKSKWTKILKYNYYTGKQYKVPVLSKTRVHAKNDYLKFRDWKCNKIFIEACNRSVHSNLKWSRRFKQLANSNYKNIIKLMMMPLIKASIIVSQPTMNNKSDTVIAKRAINQHRSQFATSSIKTVLEQSLAHQSWANINKAWANSLYCPSACYLPDLQLNYEKIIQTHQSIINQLKSQLIDQFIHNFISSIILISILNQTQMNTYNVPKIITPINVKAFTIVSTLEQLQLYRHKPIRYLHHPNYV